MNNNLPKVIIFQEDEEALNYKYKLPFTLKSDISVKSYEHDLEGFKNSGIKLIGPRPSLGDIYYLHPYKDNEYVHESYGELYFLKEKLNLYTTFAMWLGAKSISTKIFLTKSEKLEVDVEGNVKINSVDIDLKTKQTKENEYRESLEINNTIEEKDIEDFFDLNKNIDKLNKKINDLNLHHEQELINLVKDRDSRISGVRVSSRNVKSQVSSEYKSLLEVSAQLSAPVFSVGANFKRSLESVNRIDIEIDLVF